MRENWYRIYVEKGYVRNLICTKIISFHLIHFEPFQKLLFCFKGNICFFIRLKKKQRAKINTREKTYIAVARKLVHMRKNLYCCYAKISTRENFFASLHEN